MAQQQIKPIPSEPQGKKEQVAKMFDSISGNYDFLNHFLSLNIDKTWRKKAVAQLKEIAPKRILDVATGTGDLALETLKLNPTEVIGIDISNGMLAKGKEKMIKLGKADTIKMIQGDSENIEFEDNYFDAITVGFGVRNFENLEKGLSEMNRVLRVGGKAVVLEFSKPTSFPVKQFYNFYFQTILPLWGRFISKNNFAYTYLPESVKAFPDGANFVKLMEQAGFKNIQQERLTFGICSLYSGIK